MSRISFPIGLAAIHLLAACTPGGWVVEDLSSYSYRFGPAAARKPFAHKDAGRVQPPSWHADKEDDNVH